MIKRTLKPKTVLVVESDHDTRVRIRSALEAVGHFVISAANGADGLVMLEKMTVPSLIIVASDLAVMTGIDFIAALAKIAQFDKVPLAHLAEPGEASIAGTCQTIYKPVQIDKLIEAVENC